MNLKTLLFAAAAALVSAGVTAQATYEAAWADIMGRMHMGMSMETTGNADMDFAMGMIPHHQGAIDMARLQLEYGTDPELKALSETIIATQTDEIEVLTDWIARNGGN